MQLKIEFEPNHKNPLYTINKTVEELKHENRTKQIHGFVLSIRKNEGDNWITLDADSE